MAKIEMIKYIVKRYSNIEAHRWCNS